MKSVSIKIQSNNTKVKKLHSLSQLNNNYNLKEYRIFNLN
jgi:hypothetical protein